MEDLEAVFKLKIIDGFVTAITFLTCIPEAIQLHPAPPEGGLRADGLLGCLAEGQFLLGSNVPSGAWSQRLCAIALGFFEGFANIVGVRLRIDFV